MIELIGLVLFVIVWAAIFIRVFEFVYNKVHDGSHRSK